jgi:hypothetical protein
MITETTNTSAKRYNAVQFLRLIGYSYEELAILTDFELYSIEDHEDRKLYE